MKYINKETFWSILLVSLMMFWTYVVIYIFH